MPKKRDADYAIGRGLTFLAQQQARDGSFISFSSSRLRPFRRVRSWQTVFVPALMLTALANLDEPRARNVRDKLANFLLAEKSEDWSFNYWAKSALEYTSQPYPNDLDDTFCALAGLYLHDPAVIDAVGLAKIVKLLLAAEAAVGGPYRTWLVRPDSQPVWLDVDVAVNSNIAYFLSLVGSRLPRLDALMERAIISGTFSSPYYPSRPVFLYYFARAYDGPQKERLLRVVRRAHGTAQTDLDRALCLSARLRLGDTEGLEKGVHELVASQRADGSWPAAAFYTDPVKGGKLFYNGAPALTTAFVLEALWLYSRSRAAAPDNGRAAKTVSDYQRLRKTVFGLARQECRELGPELRNSVLKALERTADTNNGPEIISLAAHVNTSLAEPAKDLPTDFLTRLGLANLYGWLAYTIYDDFLDEEGKPELVSVANATLRRSQDSFREALPSDQAFSAFVRQIFDVIDSANAWEVAHCRFECRNDQLMVGKLPAYGGLAKLAERSIGHALPMVAVLAAGGHSPDSQAVRDLLTAFRHYLIARQLNDDAHDWPEDLQNGHITSVVTRLLAELKLKPGAHKLSRIMPQARQQFWNTTLPTICQLMNRHVRLSRQATRRSGLLKVDNVLADLLDGLEASITDTLSQQSQATEFLKQYKRRPVVYD